MNKRSIASVVCLAALAALLGTGCQKDQKKTQLTVSVAALQGESKVYINSNDKPCWVNGDEVCINTVGQPGQMVVSGNSVTVTVDESSDYKAIYPNEMVTSISGNQVVLNLPRVQVYGEDADGRQVVKAPMGAYTEGTHLEFTNMGSLLAISVNNDKGVDLIIDSILVSASGTALRGSATVSDISSTDRKYVMNATHSEKVNDRVSLAGAPGSNGLYTSMGKTVASGATSAEFFVYVPSVGVEFDNKYTIIVYTHEAGGLQHLFRMAQKNMYSGCIALNMIAGVPVRLGAAQEKTLQGVGKGYFSVSATQKVCFSTGNLQWTSTGNHAVQGGGTVAGTFRFAEHQYDVIGIGAGSGNAANVAFQPSTANYASGEWIDIFAYGTSGYDATDWPTYYWPGTKSKPTATDLLTNDNYDWGYYNAISNGGNEPGQWRILTKDEASYLFGRTIGRESLLKKSCTVNSVLGSILLPDDWNWNSVSSSSITSTQTTFTADEWSVMEAQGAVFLPHYDTYAKQDKGAWVSLVATTKDTYSYYWVKQYKNNSYTAMQPSQGQEKDDCGYYILAVRLVRNAETLDF